MFKLSSSPLEFFSFIDQLRDARAGAFVSFEGWARDHNDGKSVAALEYEALVPLCEAEAARILNEAKEKFEVLRAVCLHRTGRLQIGDMAVWVGVTASHRDAAFKACRYIIDEIKNRLPIWKKEFYKDGDTQWINCQ